MFLNRNKKSVGIYDIKKPSEVILNVEFENKVQKIEFNPFNSNEFVILFESYFAKIDFLKSKYKSFWFENKKINDFCFNKEENEEFILSGSFNNNYNYFYTGFLNMNRF